MFYMKKPRKPSRKINEQRRKKSQRKINNNLGKIRRAIGPLAC